MNLNDWTVELVGHKRRVAYIEWHPTAENILFSAGFDHLVMHVVFINTLKFASASSTLMVYSLRLSFLDYCVGCRKGRGHKRNRLPQ